MYNQSQPNLNPGNFIKVLGVIHFALVAAPVLFATVVMTTLIRNPVFSLSSDKSDPFIYIVPVFALAAVFAGNFLFSKLISDANNKEVFSQKLAGYQSATIIRFSLIQGVTLFAIVVAMLTNNTVFITIAALLILYMVSIRPTNNRVLNNLSLSLEEQAEIAGQ
jgi:hypothetical protein